MPHGPLHAVLLDFGGTLWSERQATRRSAEEYVERLGSVLEGLSANRAASLLAELDREASAMIESRTQDTAEAIASALRRCGLRSSPQRVESVRRALLLDAGATSRPVAGTAELLASIAAQGLSCAVVSNSFWATAADYRRDFRTWGLDVHVGLIMTSVEARIRKPDPRFFELALESLGIDAAAAAVVGDSEEKDILPARSLGLRTVLVTVDGVPPAASSADVVARSLDEVRVAIAGWGGPAGLA